MISEIFKDQKLLKYLPSHCLRNGAHNQYTTYLIDDDDALLHLVDSRVHVLLPG